LPLHLTLALAAKGDQSMKSLVAVLCCAASLACAAAQSAAPTSAYSGPVKVEIRNDRGQFHLYRAGRPYFIKGAVYDGDFNGRFPLTGLAARGANSVRYGGERALLDEAQRLGMTVLVNLPMRMEWVHHFNYSDPEAVRRQFDEMKAQVMEFKDHPAVLMWAVGNELSVKYTDLNVWNAVNDVARMIHKLDPNHPALTVIGDGSLDGGDLKHIEQRAPDLDLIGINYYAGIEKVPAEIRANHWNKPYVVTEWGPSGDWQVPRTEWNAAIEESSTEKALRFLERYQNPILKDSERCLGSYVFIWGPRHERTETWYGMLLESGERTESVNVMQYMWTGQWPSNRAPRVEELEIDGKLAADNVGLEPGSSHRATLKVTDPDGDPLTLRWEIRPEVARAGYAGMGETRSQPMPGLIQKTGEREMTFTSPAAEGAYRVFVYALDGQGNAATANIPFKVSDRHEP
jgi:hypothetical protein